jgi:RNA polymerase sigma factor (sigma-70 family)
MHTVLRHLRRAALFSAGDNLSDAQLLESFLSRRDDSAFELIMRRHGPMVLAVCRRVLRSPQDVEDVFQATFLVLIRKAGSLRSQASLGNWLYGVAHRTAMKARTMNAKRRARESAAGNLKRPTTEVDEELLKHLDAAIEALPDKFRAPVVLCELEGKTRKEAARLLGLTEDSVAWRLRQGRNLLAKKLARYVGVVAVSALSTALSEGAVVPRLLLTTTLATARQFAMGGTVQAGVVSAHVVLLTEGVIKAMLLSKLKLVGVAMLVLSLGAGATGIGLRAGAAETPTKIALNEVEALRAEVEALRKLVLVTRDRVQTLEKEVETLKTPQPRPATITEPKVGPFEAPAPAYRPVPANTAPKRPGKPTPPAAPAPLSSQSAPPAPMPSDSAAPQPSPAAAKNDFSPPSTQRQPAATTPAMPRQPGHPAAPVPNPARSQFERGDATLSNPEHFLEAITGTYERGSKQLHNQLDPFAEAEEALKQLRQHPENKEAADRLERALQLLKAQRQAQKQTQAMPNSSQGKKN